MLVVIHEAILGFSDRRLTAAKRKSRRNNTGQLGGNIGAAALARGFGWSKPAGVNTKNGNETQQSPRD